MIDMIFKLHCIKFFHYLMSFILQITFFSKLFITPICFELTNIHYDIFLLGELIQRLKLSSQTIDLSRHTVLSISLR